MSKVKFTVIFAAGAVAGAFGMYALNVALARDGGALGGEALVIPLVVLLLWAGYCLGHAKETVAELLDLRPMRSSRQAMPSIGMGTPRATTTPWPPWNSPDRPASGRPKSGGAVTGRLCRNAARGRKPLP